jgi:prephenate dehydrogenase
VPDRPGVLAEVTTLASELDVNIADLEIAHSAEGTRGVVVLLVDANAGDVLRDALAARGYHPSLQPLP